MRLLLEGVRQAYGGNVVLDDINLDLAPGRIGCLLGRSGCGKTTVLRCIAGFEPLQAGRIVVGTTTLCEPGIHLEPEQRGVGMVFQSYALFPHLGVAGNVGFGLHGLKAGERDARVREMLELTGLADVASALPHELSGGQRQRVALARALAPQPGLLLLDEPFSSLDQELRHRLSGEVREILRRIGATALLVTHDQNEAFAMADEIGVMNAGRIEQWGRADELYHHPATAFVAGFVGEGSLLPGSVVADGRVKTALGELQVNLLPGREQGDAVEVLVRPDDVVCDESAAVRGKVLRRDFRGGDCIYTLALSEQQRLLVRDSSLSELPPGADIGVRVCGRDLAAFAVSASNS